MFVVDENRKKMFELIDRRLKKGGSIAIVGAFGVGKTELGKQVREKYPDIIAVSPYATLVEILGQMTGKKDVQRYLGRNHFMTALKAYPQKIMIDEAQDLPRAIFPMLKEVIDAGNTVILIGKTDLDDEILDKKFPDLQDRFLTFHLNRLTQAEIEKQFVGQFDEEAWAVIFSNRKKSMRVVFDIIDDCLRHIAETGEKVVTYEIAKEQVGV